MLEMLTFGAFIVIHRSNYLSRGKMVQFHIFFIFSLYLKNIIIYFYILWLNTCIVSLKIPAKYHDNRLDILTWDPFFLSYAILPRIPWYDFVSKWTDSWVV